MLVPNWNAPPNIRAFTTTREGGVSPKPFDTFNLGNHVGDDPTLVDQNRLLLKSKAELPNDPIWIQQVHGTDVLEITDSTQNPINETYDASFTFSPNKICAVLTADCLPVLLCDEEGTFVSAIHAGWKGLAAGVIESTVEKIKTHPHIKNNILAWLGPAIGPKVFRMGKEVLDLFQPIDKAAFTQIDENYFLLDIYKAARNRLNQLGIDKIYGGDYCTYTMEDQFFSYRRSNMTGRMATLIWLKKDDI